MLDALYYRPSGKFSPILPLTLLAALVVAWPFAWLYAWICDNIPFIYLNVLATFGYAIVLAALVFACNGAGHARNPVVMALLSCLFATAAWYVQWACWLEIVVHEHPGNLPLEIAQADSFTFAMHPLWIAQFMQTRYGHGAWTFHSVKVSGLLSAACWVIEYGMIVGLPTYAGYSQAATPYCEGEHRRAEEKKLLQQFKVIDDKAAFVAEAESARDALGHLLKHQAPGHEKYAQLRIWVCGEGEDCFATVENVTVEWKDHKRKTEERAVLEYLRISWQAAQNYLRKSDEIEKKQAAGKAKEEAERKANGAGSSG